MGRVLVIGSDQEPFDALVGSPELRGHEISGGLGEVDALLQLRRRAADVIVTSRVTPIREGLALARELSEVRPGVRTILLAPAATREDVVEALRAHVFACFTPPFDDASIIEMVRAALNASEWRDGIEVVSGLPNWLTLKVSCHLLTAERLVRFMTEHQAALVEHEGDLLMIAFREMLLNAMEHGAGFDPEKVIEVTAARTARTIVYHFRDPGAGFDRADLICAASPDPEDALANAQRRAEAGLRPGGFGMLIARQVADELVYNERGNEVLMIKHLS
jgi:anti-sigma regulatory factor (Ser/Thr protein kinase)